MATNCFYEREKYIINYILEGRTARGVELGFTMSPSIDMTEFPSAGGETEGTVLPGALLSTILAPKGSDMRKYPEGLLIDLADSR